MSDLKNLTAEPPRPKTPRVRSFASELVPASPDARRLRNKWWKRSGLEHYQLQKKREEFVRRHNLQPIAPQVVE